MKAGKMRYIVSAVLSGCALLFLGSPDRALASDWRALGSTSTADYLIDVSSVTQTPSGTKKAWTKKDQRRDPSTKARTTLEQWEVRCALHEFRIVSLASYDAHGNQLVAGRPGQDYSDIIPDTMGKKIERAICSN